jgi:hypothetical protein
MLFVSEVVNLGAEAIDTQTAVGEGDPERDGSKEAFGSEDRQAPLGGEQIIVYVVACKAKTYGGQKCIALKETHPK